jgi:hypothetical protein
MQPRKGRPHKGWKDAARKTKEAKTPPCETSDGAIYAAVSKHLQLKEMDALLAEVERLRAEVRSLHDTKRWNIKAGDAPGELLICVGEHHKDEPCDFHSYIRNQRS